MAPVGAGPFYPDIESARPLPREDTRSPLSATGLSFWEGQADDLALRARLGAGGRRLVEREFSEERIAAATLALWRRLLAPPDSGR